MTKEEYQNWISFTESSFCKWNFDPCQWGNRKTILAFTGGAEKGVWITIDRDGKASAGTYEGAYPCITDAEFKVQHQKQFADQGEAFTKICEKVGARFLLDWTQAELPDPIETVSKI